MRWLIFISLIFATLQINHAKPKHNCPNLEVKENVSDPFVAQKLKRDLMRATLNMPSNRNPSPLVQKLREILYEMADSDSFYFTEVAYYVSGWVTAMLSTADHLYPNLCPFAEVINKTAQWDATGSKMQYLDALNETVQNFEYGMSGIKYVALLEMGCSNITPPFVNFNVKPCYKNGLVANLDVVWNDYGRLMPWPLRSITQQLMDSPLFKDRGHAIMLTFALTPPQQYFYSRQVRPSMMEARKYMAYAYNISKCCCKLWDKKLDEFTDFNYKTGQQTVEDKRQEILKEC